MPIPDPRPARSGGVGLGWGLGYREDCDAKSVEGFFDNSGLGCVEFERFRREERWGQEENELAKRGKGARGMPRRGQAMKDVASCDKPGGAARRL